MSTIISSTGKWLLSSLIDLKLFLQIIGARSKATKRWLELSRLAVVPVIYLLLVIAEHSGLIDHWRGLDRVQAVADRFGLSYAPDASKPVYPSDPEWKPLIDLLQKYSKVKLRTDKQPRTVARFVATLSARQEIGKGNSTEWTSPHLPGNTCNESRRHCNTAFTSTSKD